MRIGQSLLGVILTVSISNGVRANEPASPSPRELLRASAHRFAYPGGMLFHNSFFEGLTTRFLLLKAAVHSEELTKYFALNEQQRLHIADLQPVTLDKKDLDGAPDPNAQPDEQTIDAKYFDFLKAEQLRRLDALAFVFDGYVALTRKSLADHLTLTETSRTKIAQAALKFRESAILPQFRSRFAGTQPKDGPFHDCLFAGSACTQLNLEIIGLLTDQECEQLRKLLVETHDEKVISATVKLAVLPLGILALDKFRER